jgi:hypothetical protein
MARRKTLKTFVPIVSKNSASGDVMEESEREELMGDSQSGGGTGFSVGGGADWAAFAAGGVVVLTGITDSSLALLVAGSCVSPPPEMRHQLCGRHSGGV